jgi:hypothetical protein
MTNYYKALLEHSHHDECHEARTNAKAMVGNIEKSLPCKIRQSGKLYENEEKVNKEANTGTTWKSQGLMMGHRM